MIRAYMRFPGGVSKTLTLSYDDGVEQDIRLVEILDKHGIKCTFNINSGRFAPEGKVYPEGKIHRPMTKSQATALYSNSGHEVAVHTYTHPWLETLPKTQVINEVMEDRKALEEQFGGVIRGMAYPYGTYNDDVVDVLRDCGILYSRTTVSTNSFSIPTDWLRLPATCHHKSSQLMELAEKFVTAKSDGKPIMFYLWGHSYEFEEKNNWNVIEDFCEYIGGKEDIWYATNGDIFEYIDAYNKLIWSADMSAVKNPTSSVIWFEASRCGVSPKIYTVNPGETISIDQ